MLTTIGIGKELNLRAELILKIGTRALDFVHGYITCYLTQIQVVPRVSSNLKSLGVERPDLVPIHPWKDHPDFLIPPGNYLRSNKPSRHKKCGWQVPSFEDGGSDFIVIEVPIIKGNRKHSPHRSPLFKRLNKRRKRYNGKIAGKELTKFLKPLWCHSQSICGRRAIHPMKDNNKPSLRTDHLMDAKADKPLTERRFDRVFYSSIYHTHFLVSFFKRKPLIIP